MATIFLVTLRNSILIVMTTSENNGPFLRHRIIVDMKQRPYRLDKFLAERLSSSRTRIQAGISCGNIKVNQQYVKAKYPVKPGDILEVFLPNPVEVPDIVAENIPLDIVYEDAHLLVVNKAAEMVVHPGTGNWQGTLVNGLMYHFEHLPAQKGNEHRPGLLHRIDKGTSGLLLVAKTEIALSGLAKQFSDHAIERVYWALVWGTPKEKEGTIDIPIGRSLSDRRIMVPYKDSTRGKRSITHYKILEELGYVTLVECRLETGRTHQIRVHMKYLGHPLFGDTRYGGDRICKGPLFSKYKSFIRNCFQILPYQALHAGTLGFIHPVTKKKCCFEVPLPPPFAEVMTKWTQYNPSLHQ